MSALYTASSLRDSTMPTTKLMTSTGESPMKVEGWIASLAIVMPRTSKTSVSPPCNDSH
jgi:hypothetical protein